jgi:ubiquinone/menaquinone biosynthesis C-methylase UbiE
VPTINDYEVHYAQHDRYWKTMPTLFHTLYVFPAAEGFIARRDWIVENAIGDVLDCGCNDGTYIEAVRLKGHKTAGIDLIPLNIERAHILYPDGEFHVMDCEDLKFKDESFDTVVFTETVEHLVDPRKALREIHRVMRKGGRLLCTTTYIPGEPTHYQDFHDKEVFLKLLSEFFTVMDVTIGIAGCIQVVAARRELDGVESEG